MKITIFWIAMMTFYFTVVVGWPLELAIPIWIVMVIAYRIAYKKYVKG